MYICLVYSKSTQDEKYTPMDVYCTSCFGYVKFSGFPMTKTSANKRLFIYMSANGCIATVCRSGIYIARRFPYHARR